MTNQRNKNLTIQVIYTLVRIIIAAVLISAFKHYHIIIGSLFLGLLIFSFIRSYRKNNLDKSAFWLSTFGTMFTLISGWIVEIWGTTYGHWTYLDLPENINIPFWVPFAWGLAYKAIYRVELALLKYFSTPFEKWLYCVILPAMALPVIGEIIVIYFGTWTYSCQPQYLGMPLLAVVLLGIFHVCIFLSMCKISQYFSIKDPVYSSFITIK